MNAAIKAELSGGISYAAARQEALRKIDPRLAEVLSSPNNILAVEYVKAIYDEGARLEPMTVQRLGSGHDEDGDRGPKSASEIRRRLHDGEAMSALLPAEAAGVFEREERSGRGFVGMDSLEIALLSRLRLMDIEVFNKLPDSGGGTGNALYNAVREEPGLDAVAAAAKSRSIAMSRIRRMMMCAALGVCAGMADGIPPYARVLALSGTGRELLRTASSVCDVPIITKPADAHRLDARGESVFSLGSDAHDLYVLGYRAAEERRGGADWRTGPSII
jgi:predicted nucleotidyltransferase